MGRSLSDIQRLLIEWAAWRVSEHGANVGYPSRATGPWPLKSGRTPAIDDAMAMRVDRAVARLKVRCGDGDHRWDALTDCYILGKSDPAIARRLRIHRKAAMAARHAAEAWVDAHIDASLDIE